MRITPSFGWNAILCAIAAIIAVVISPADPAFAGGPVATRGAVAADGFSTTHESLIRIGSNERLPQHRSITIGSNKSVLIELPHELRDVVVSNPDYIDAMVQSSSRVYLIGKKNGQANVFFFDSRGERILTLEVRIEPDTTPLDRLLHKLLPNSNIKTEILNDTLILTGSVRSPIDSNRAADIASRFGVTNPSGDGRAKGKVVNMLAVEGEDQVMLRVTIAEVNRTTLKQLGINLGAAFSSGNLSVTALTENTLPITSSGGLGSIPVIGLALAQNGSCLAGGLCAFNGSQASGGGNAWGNSGVLTSYSNGSTSVMKALRMLEREGLVRTLAEPNLTTVSGETAKFLAGGEYPFPSVNNDGALNVTFKEFGVGLAFTPVVLSEGRISLKVETEVSELDSANGVTIAGSNIPGIKKRTAKAVLELPSGGSMALAGLISDNVRQNIDGVPGVKDLPVLGTLFRSRDFVRAETELVVIVTPFMVRPTARQKLARPDDGFAPATDLKANFLGHLNRIYGRGTLLPSGGLKGDYGFIVE
ncbi:MAG: type II and III secretion system protein family protein [Hyphomicrobiaceae bacterium]